MSLRSTRVRLKFGGTFLSVRTSSAQGNQTDVDHIVAEAATIRPAARDNAPVVERILRLALQHVTAKEAETAEPGGTSQAGRLRGQVNLDHVRNVDLAQQAGDDRCELERARDFRIVGVFGKILRVLDRLGLVVAILVDLGDKDLAEQRITLTAYLLEELLVAITVVIEKTREGAAGRCIYAGDFGASEFVSGMFSTMVWTLKPLWLSNGLVGVLRSLPKENSRSKMEWMSRIEAVVALPGKDPVPILQFEDRVLGIVIEVVGVRNTGLRRLIAVIVLVVKSGHATLIVRRNHACAEESGPVDERARNSFEAVVNQCHRIGLAQVLIGRKYTRAGWLDGSAERQDRVGANTVLKRNR